MRSASIVAAAMAAGALAVPYQRRDTVINTEVDVVYVTDVVTVTKDGPAPTPTEGAHSNYNWGSGGWNTNWGGWGGSGDSTTVVETEQPAPTSTEEVQPTEPAMSSPTTAEHTSEPSSRTVDPVQASPTSVATGGSGAAPTSYAQVAVYAHNLHRRNHSAPDIAWSNNLAKSAQIIAESCYYEHNTSVMGGGYGQNIAAGVKPQNISAVITSLFYNGEVNWFSGLYGMAQPPMTNFEHWGHFSQVVWKTSTHLGCYTADCTASGLRGVGSDVMPYFTVCNYKGAGNYANEYGSNIGSPLGLPTAQWNTGLNLNLPLPTLPQTPI